MSRGTNVPGNKCPGIKCPREQMSWGTNVPGNKCPGEQMSGEQMSLEQKSWEKTSWEINVLSTYLLRTEVWEQKLVNKSQGIRCHREQMWNTLPIPPWTLGMNESSLSLLYERQHSLCCRSYSICFLASKLGYSEAIRIPTFCPVGSWGNVMGYEKICNF